MVSDLANQGGRQWHETRGGQALLAAQRRGAVESWACPMHVFETSLCADFDERHQVTDTAKLDLRQAIASTHLHLAEAKRMAPAYEFLLAEHFMKMLDEVAPGAVRNWVPLEGHVSTCNRDICLARTTDCLQRPFLYPHT
jgi:hypothetical protein